MKTRQLFISLRILVLLTIVTGILYPVFLTSVAQLLFPLKAHGSLLRENDKVVGSALIGQSFDSTVGYFVTRPSVIQYNPMPSGGSNLGPTSKKLSELVSQREAQFRSMNELAPNTAIPAEMLYASASGLDPHTSPESALLQLNRVCSQRNFNDTQKNKVRALIDKLTEKPQYLCFGEMRINIVLLNLELDKIR